MQQIPELDVQETSTEIAKRLKIHAETVALEILLDK